MKFVVYSKPNCPYCEKAKMTLTNKGYDWAENKLGTDFDRDEMMEMFPQARTFPQVVLLEEGGNTNIGGYDELVKWLSVKELSL
jgi:glutaredoxin 3